MPFQKYKICQIDLYLEIHFTVSCYHLNTIKTTSSCCLTGFSLSIMIKIFGNGVERQVGIKSLFFSKKIICKLDQLSHFISGITTFKNMAKHLLKSQLFPWTNCPINVASNLNFSDISLL